LKGFALLRQQIDQNITALMRGSQRKQRHSTALSLVHFHSIQQLNAPPFRYLGRADRANPNAATGLKPGVTGRAVLLGLPNLNV
jgi:hypothetical protein